MTDFLNPEAPKFKIKLNNVEKNNLHFYSDYFFFWQKIKIFQHFRKNFKPFLING